MLRKNSVSGECPSAGQELGETEGVISNLVASSENISAFREFVAFRGQLIVGYGFTLSTDR